MIKLHDYQVDAVNHARERLAAGIQSLCLVAPTGAGKTLVASFIIKSALQRHKRILFLAHRRELIKQCANKIQLAGVDDFGMILSGQQTDPEYDHPLQIASVQTLVNRDLPPADLVIIDEAHHAVEGGQYQSILSQYPRAYRLGLTATPQRLDGKPLNDLFQELLVVATVPNLIARGFLIAPRCFPPAPEAAQRLRDGLSLIGQRGGDFAKGATGDMMNTSALVGDLVESWLMHAEGRQTLVFAVHRAHSRHIVEAFRARGLRAAHLDGAMRPDEQDRILSDLRDGTIQIVSNCMIATEGFDYPELSCCVLARPTMSLALFLQMVGRIMRTAPGKTDAVLLDHAANLYRHGPPHVDRVWTLEDTHRRKPPAMSRCVAPGCGVEFMPTAARRWEPTETQPFLKSDYQWFLGMRDEMDGQERREMTVASACPTCGSISCKACATIFIPAHDPTCPACGLIYGAALVETGTRNRLPESIDGDLVAFDDELMRPVLRQVQIRNDYHRFLNIARQKSLKRGWVWHRLQELYTAEEINAALPRHTGDWWKQHASYNTRKN